MKIRISTSAVLKHKGHYLLPLAALLSLFSMAGTQVANQQKSIRRVTGLLVGQATEGSRVTVVGDSTLDDYEAFRRGDRFYVKIPATEFIGMRPSLHGDGFDDVQVQKVGDSVVISFKLQPGAHARVDGGANQLEVIFFSPSRMAGINNANATAVRNRVITHNSGRGGNSTNGSKPKRGSDVAGPMPPESPTGYSPRNVQDSTSVDSANSGTASSVRAPNRRTATPKVEPATDNAVPSSSPNQTATPYASSPYSSTYAPAGHVATPIAQTPTVAATSWRNRIQGARQWVAVNRMGALIGGVALLALLGLMVFVLHRRRTARKVRLNTPRVQPKYSPDVELEDMLASRASDVSARVAPGPYVDEDAYDHWGDSIIGSETSADLQGDAIYKSATRDDFSGTKDEPWEFVGTPDPPVYQGRVQEEREVFEL